MVAGFEGMLSSMRKRGILKIPLQIISPVWSTIKTSRDLFLEFALARRRQCPPPNKKKYADVPDL
jgi:hypothetical protein